MRLSLPMLCVILPLLVPVLAKTIPLPDDYVVGVFPSFDIILHGMFTGIKQWLGILLPDLKSGDTFKQLLGTLGSLFTNVKNDTSTGVLDLEDTLKEPITSLD